MKVALKSKLGGVAVRLKPKAKKKSGNPCSLGTTTKPPKRGKGGNYKTLGRLKYSKLAIQLGMRERTLTRPFIVRVLSQGKPMKNTVLQNRTCT